MKKQSKHLFLFILVILTLQFYGCGGYLSYMYDKKPIPAYMGGKPSEVPPTLLMGRDSVPEKPYIVLQGVYNDRRKRVSNEAILEGLQDEAQKLGASAIMDIKLSKFQKEDYPLLFMINDIDDNTYGKSTVIRTYKEISGIAIKYIDELEYDPSLIRFVSFSCFDSFDVPTEVARINYSLEQERQPYGYSEEESPPRDLVKVYENKIKEYTQYHIAEEKDGWERKGNKVIFSRRLRKRGLCVKECTFQYKFGNNYKRPYAIEIEYPDDLSKTEKEIVNIEYNSNGDISRRIIHQEGGNKVIEEWNYDSIGRLSDILYYNEGSEKPFAIRKQQYFTKLQWNDVIRARAFYPSKE